MLSLRTLFPTIEFLLHPLKPLYVCCGVTHEVMVSVTYTGDGMRVPITEICLLPAEFDEYQIGVDASVTFCLRELRVHCRIVVCVRAEMDK